jgi:hypothetical protein
MSLDLTTHTSLSPIRRGFAPGFVNYKKGCTLGYKIFDKEYFDILTILGYSTYKSYYVSEQKTKAIDVYNLFVRELRSKLNVCKNIYSSVLFNKIQKCIEK